MKPFRFSLARLLGLRERAERDAAVSLAEARNMEAAIAVELERVKVNRDAARAGLLPDPGQTNDVGNLRTLAFAVEQLDKHIVGLTRQLQACAEETARRHAVLTGRVRDRRVLERLRDRQLALWRTVSEREDRETMDAFRPHAGLESPPTEQSRA